MQPGSARRAHRNGPPTAAVPPPAASRRVAVAATTSSATGQAAARAVAGAGNVFADHEPRVAEMLGDERQQPPHHHRQHAAGHLELHAAVEHQHQQHRDERRAGAAKICTANPIVITERNAGDRREHCCA